VVFSIGVGIEQNIGGDVMRKVGIGILVLGAVTLIAPRFGYELVIASKITELLNLGKSSDPVGIALLVIGGLLTALSFRK
jgi:hypothetical protein